MFHNTCTDYSATNTYTQKQITNDIKCDLRSHYDIICYLSV